MKFHMKKTRIRIISFLLALLMVVSAVPMPTFADVETFVETLAQETTETESQIDEQENSENESVSETESESASEAESEFASEAESESASEVESESASEVESESVSEAESESASEAESESASEVESEFASEAESESPSEASPSNAEKVCESCGIDPCECKNILKMGVLKLAGKNASAFNLAAIWENAENATYESYGDEYKIGFIDSEIESFMVFGDTISTEVKIKESPEYFILKGEYVSDEDGSVLMYEIDSADDDFFFSVLVNQRNNYVEADVFYDVVDVSDLYATVKDSEEITLWADLSVATDTYTVEAGTLSEEYLVEAMAYEAVGESGEWFVKLEQIENWPEDADGYVWMRAACIAELSEEKSNVEEGISAIVNGQTIVVSGDAVPEGASLEVSIPEINGEALPGVFDIKIFDENGDEWQPIDDEATVTVSIPVEGVEDGEYVDIIHYVDNAEAIDEEKMVFSIEDVEEDMRPFIQSAVDAYGDGVHFAIELFQKVLVDSGKVLLETESFSIYQWDGSTYYKSSDSDEKVTFNNIIGSIKDATYYASPGQTFTIVTKRKVGILTDIADPFSLDANTTVAYRNENEIFRNATDDEEPYNEGWLGSKTYNSRWAYVTVPETAAVGQKIIVKFTGESTNATLTINVAREVTIQYNSNGKEATGMPNPLSYTTIADGDRVTFTVSSTKPSAPNCNFIEWNTSPAGDGDSYTSGDGFSPTRDLVLYAIWQADQYTVKFDHNNGTNIVTEQVADYNTSIAVPEDPKRENYKFLGWSATTDGYSHLYQPGEALTVVSDVTMFAVWGVDLTIIVSGGTVKLQKIDETVFTEIEDHSDQYEESVDSSGADVYHIVLVENSYESANFEFVPSSNGLKLSRSSTGANITFVDQTNKINAVISSAGVTANTTITFSATEMQSYIVSYETNYGTPIPSTTVLEDANSIANLPEATRDGYKFEDWYKDSSLTDGPYTSLANITSNITLYAKWSVQSYKIIYKLNGGSMPEGKSNPESYTCETETFTLNNPERIGYTFTGWTGTGLSNATTEVKVVKGSTGTREYTATWTENTVVISYLAGENGSVRLKTSSLLDESVEETIKVWTGEAEGTVAVADSGYKFVGWYEGEKLVSTQEIWAPTKNDDGMWELASYTAKFERALADLTIAVASRADDSSFVFYISGTPDDTSYGYISLDVVLAGRNSITIKDLPVGTYLVHEKSKWSWRLVDVDDKSTDLKSVNTVAFDFTNVARKNLWLNGYSYGLAKFVNGGNS